MDNLYKEHFSNTQTHVEDPEALWAAIEQQRKSVAKCL